MTSRAGLKTVASVAAMLTLAACECGEPCNPEIDDECEFDAGPPPEDWCNSPEEALSDTTHCVLPLACGLDGGQQAFINPPADGGIDVDWYSASFGTLTPRSLLRVYAGYAAPVTAVDLAVTVLNETATQSLIRAVDDHGQGAPQPIDILMPYTSSNTKLLFLVSDKGGRPPVFDVRNKYFISVCTQENPDGNEPNDTPDDATPIPLAQSGAVLQGQNTGYLATDNDVDRFLVDVPANMPGARNLIHVRLTTAEALTPPPPFRLSFVLYDPSGAPIAEAVTPNAFLQVDLSTAKLVRTPGQYTVVVQGYRPNPNDMSVIQGDLRLQYTVDVQVMEDLDMQEPNDSISEAVSRVRMLSPGQSASITGRLSYVPDPEFFGFDIPPSGGHSTLYVRLTAAQGGGRFGALAGPRDRQLRVMTPVPGANVPASINACLTDNAACPKGYPDDDEGLKNLVSGICTAFIDAGSAHCLWLERNQFNNSPNFPNLRNMQGTVPIPPHGGTVRYWVIVQDEGNNWADDVEWTLNVSLSDDPDEARFSSGPLAASVPSTVNGVITYGYGRTYEHDLQRCAASPSDRCQGIRAPYDYDAVASDQDTFTYDLPSAMDESWGFSWEIDKGDGGSLPGELLFEINFCGQASGGGCRRGIIGYQSGNFQPWYGTELTDRVFGWDRQDMGSFVRVTARPNQCLCFMGATTRIEMSVNAVDRDSYAPISYRVSHTAGTYTGLFPGDGGVPTTCGPAQADGGIPACRNAPN